jgi:molybdopterin-biosynthesis enzyme MoeA-like protein
MCPSCNENAYSEIAPELGPRRMTKYSLSESLLAPQLSELQKQHSEIMLSYHKLKISFTCEHSDSNLNCARDDPILTNLCKVMLKI